MLLWLILRTKQRVMVGFLQALSRKGRAGYLQWWEVKNGIPTSWQDGVQLAVDTATFLLGTAACSLWYKEGRFWVIAVNFFLVGGRDRQCNGRQGVWVDTFVNWNQTVNERLEVKSKFLAGMEMCWIRLLVESPLWCVKKEFWWMLGTC